MPYLPRIVDAQLAALLEAFPVVVLNGVRGIGKTTTAERVTSTQFRFPRDLTLVESDPLRVLSRAKPPVLIDEWQLAGVDLLWALKDIADREGQGARFLLTGSVSPESYGPTYPLTGRGVQVTMYPMVRRELDGKGDTALWLERLLDGDLAHPGRGGSVLPIDDILRSGFPAADRAGNDSAWLRTYASTIAERDIEGRHDPARLMRLMRVLAESESGVMPDEHLWRAADINRETFLSYMQLLTRTNIRGDLPAWDSNQLKRITRYPKRQYVDAAMALALARVGPARLSTDPGLVGRHLESFIAAQLRPECELLGAAMYHLRTKGGEHEVDLLIEMEQGVVAIEVKANVQPKAADARHLVWLREQLGSRMQAAVVLHRGDATFELAEGVWAVPVSTLLG